MVKKEIFFLNKKAFDSLKCYKNVTANPPKEIKN